MKFIRLSIFILIAFLLCTSIVLADVSPADKTEIQNQVILIVDAVNEGDASSILNIVSPNARVDLRGELEENVAGKAIWFQQSIVSYEDLGNNQVRVKGKYAAEGTGWSVSGLSNYYVFEKVGDSWLLFDTNFHKKLGPGSVLAIVGPIIGVVVAICLILGAFTLWMLIDAIKRQFDDKTLWIILIIFLGPLGAILYFFMVRRKLRRQEKLGGQPP